MQKKQVIVILATLIGVGIVFSLPKVLVNNKKETVKGSETGVPEKDSTDMRRIMAEKHTNKPTALDQKKILVLTKNYYSVSDKEKKRIFADSILEYFKQFHQYDSVAKYSEELAKVFPAEDNWVTAGDAYMQASDLVPAEEKSSYSDKSRELYKKALELDPENPDTKSKLAMTYVTTSTPMEGIKLLREVIEKNPDNQTALFNLGYLSMQSGQYNKAVDRFKKLIEVNPKHASGTFYLGLSYLQLGNKDKAKGFFERAKNLDKDPEFQSIIDSYLKETN